MILWIRVEFGVPDRLPVFPFGISEAKRLGALGPRAMKPFTTRMPEEVAGCLTTEVAL